MSNTIYNLKRLSKFALAPTVPIVGMVGAVLALVAFILWLCGFKGMSILADWAFMYIDWWTRLSTRDNEW